MMMSQKKTMAGLALILSLSSTFALAWNDPGSEVSFSSDSSSYSHPFENAGNLFVSKSSITGAPGAFRLRPKDQCSNVMVPIQFLSKDPRDQGSRGYCFAYAAADVISQKIGKEVSAIDVAFAYFKKNARAGDTATVMDLSGGFPVDAALAAAGRGFCEETALPSNSYVDRYLKDPRKLRAQYPDVDVYIRTGFAWQLVPSQFKDFSGLIKWLGGVHSSYKNGQVASLSSEFTDLNYIFPALSEQEFRNSLEKNRNASGLDFVDDILSGICEGHRLSFDQKIEGEALSGRGSLIFSALDAALNRGSIVAIDYYVDEMIKKESNERLGFSPGRERSGHASSIVGRRFNDQTRECEYLIRNSWGKSCEHYSPEFQARCKNGSLWVGESFLNRNLDGIFYLK